MNWPSTCCKFSYLAFAICLGFQHNLTLLAQNTDLSIVYSGRSFGALGSQRIQDEHELITAQAAEEKKAFKLVSHHVWRAPGVTVFMPSDEPRGDEIAEIMSLYRDAERKESVPALLSQNVLLVQDPWRGGENLFEMLERNPKRKNEFRDLVQIYVTVSRVRTAKGQRVTIVEQADANWPKSSSGWIVGEMNRIDVGEARMFELPFIVGAMGSRATLIHDLMAKEKNVLLVDLGHQDGEMGHGRYERAMVDFSALYALGYKVVVPFEFELAMGLKDLDRITEQFPGIGFLASNIKVSDTIFKTRMVVQYDGIKVGLLGLVSPELKDRLPRSSLNQFAIESPLQAAKREIELLRQEGVHSIIVLSNMNPSDNATIAEEIRGIDAIVADMPVRKAPETVRMRVELPDRPLVRPGIPALIARAAANGIGLGHLKMHFRSKTNVAETPSLSLVEHAFLPITDKIPVDMTFMHKILKISKEERRPRGEVLFPAFTDLEEAFPKIASYDEITKTGRVSQGLWEEFMAKRLLRQSDAEVAVIRRLEQFPPLVGKLHEREIEQWLWTEDEVVELDMSGADLKALLRDDIHNELAYDGIDLSKNLILGHRVVDAHQYRITTTDVIYEGSRAGYFARARRVHRNFNLDSETGKILVLKGRELEETEDHRLSLREFMINELKLVKLKASGTEQIKLIGNMLLPEDRVSNLTTFSFDRPTIWTSLNTVNNNEGYERVPESRILAKDAFVAGANGRFVLSREAQRAATDLGFGFAYATQKVRNNGTVDNVESADDIKLDLTIRPSTLRTQPDKLQPFARGLFDSEFSPTINSSTNIENPRQLSLRAVGGVLLTTKGNWRNTDIGLVLENDFGRPNPQLGLQSRSQYDKQLGSTRTGFLTYRLRNDLTYFFPAPKDTEANLGLRYNMIHDILIPLFDELSLSVTADLLFFKGKVEQTKQLGLSSQLRVGITYNRLWKPRYQPLF